MRREVTVREDQLLVRVTIPARFVAKTPCVHYKQAPEQKVYDLIWASFGISLGRCKWENPIVIVATPHQFGIFMALMHERGLTDLAAGISYYLFSPPKVPTVHRFDASSEKLGLLTVRAELMDPEGLLEA